MTFTDLLAAFQLPFIMRGLLTMLMLAAAASIIGLFVSFRDLEFVTDGLVHAVFPGLVIGYIIGGSALLLPGALVAATIAVVLITLLTQRGKLGNDAAVAVILTSAFSLGIVLVSRQQDYVSALNALLFGHLLTVTATQLIALSCVALLSVLMILMTWRRQIFRAHDVSGFRAAGYSVLATDLILGVAIAFLIVAGVQALGNLLVTALLIVPTAAARQLTNRLWGTVLLAFLITAFASFVGIAFAIWSSFALGVNTPAGAAVVLALIAIYGLTLLPSLARKLQSRKVAQ
ncbi:metal ABC transporter permease [Canibacter zhoujuaniae]|uniref:metal ABC transporter permease n=1 Tax=Canibacter zhoujuaniae TaxID=2708343 RepID=UPI001FB8E814|nr:metal ABC transporter permease [Canibacter zhoujuaniae]